MLNHAARVIGIVINCSVDAGLVALMKALNLAREVIVAGRLELNGRIKNGRPVFCRFAQVQPQNEEANRMHEMKIAIADIRKTSKCSKRENYMGGTHNEALYNTELPV